MKIDYNAQISMSYLQKTNEDLKRPNGLKSTLRLCDRNLTRNL